MIRNRLISKFNQITELRSASKKTKLQKNRNKVQKIAIDSLVAKKNV